jgi:hypothetical protein
MPVGLDDSEANEWIGQPVMNELLQTNSEREQTGSGNHFRLL